MTLAVNETFSPSGTSGQLTIGGANVVSGAVISSLVRTDWDGVITLNPASRTSIVKQSILPGAGAAPTGWSQGVGTGTSAPAASIYGNADGAQAYAQTATAQRPWIYQTVTVAANTTYCVSLIVETVSAGMIATEVLLPATLPAGATVSFPVCTANPSGGSAGVLTAGVLVVVLTVVATAGTFICRTGLGCANPITGTLQFSRPQVELGTTRGSFIPTTAAAASVTDYSYTDAGVVTLGQTATGTYAWSGSGDLASASPAGVDQTQYGMGGTYSYGRSFHASVPVHDDDEMLDGFLRDVPLVPEIPAPVKAPSRPIARRTIPVTAVDRALISLYRAPLVAKAPKVQAKPTEAEALKKQNDHALRLLLLAS